MMLQTPFGHDRTATRNDARHTIRRQRHKTQQHTGMNRHVIHALLALFDHRVAEQFPAELGRIILHLFERLIHWHSANRHGGVAQNPFTSGVNVVAGRQIHHSVGTPLGGPRELLHLLVNRRSDRRIAHIGVELGEELRADDHGFSFGMVDIARHDRTPCGQFAAYQFHAAMLAFRHIAHFRRDDIVARVPHLRHRMILGLHRLMLATTPFLGSLATFDGALTIVLEIASTTLILLDVAAVTDPVETQRSQALLRIAFRTFGVVILEWCVRSDARSVRQFDFGVWHLQIVGTEFVFEMHRRGLTNMRLVALLGIARRDVDALLLGKLGCGLGFFGVGEPLLACFYWLLGFLRALHTWRVAMPHIAAHRLPACHHLAGRRFRVVGSCDCGHHEPACRL